MRRVIESDICIIGSGITAALAAEKIAAERDASIVVVEAGDETASLENRHVSRRRYLAYGENPWPDDHIDGQTADGIQSRSMLVISSTMLNPRSSCLRSATRETTSTT